MAPYTGVIEPQPQTKVTQTQATLRQSQNFIVQVFSKIDLDVFFFSYAVIKDFLVNLSKKAIQ